MGQYDDYLATLPQGLDSYPDTVVAATRIGGALAVARGLSIDAVRLPTELAGYANQLIPASTWVPEVHYYALVLSIVDQRAMSVESLEKFSANVTLHVLKHPLYRLLFRWLQPQTMLKRAADRWDTFSRGTQVTWDGTTFTFQFPPHLLNEVLARGVAAGWQAYVRRSRVPSASFTLRELTETTAVMVLKDA